MMVSDDRLSQCVCSDGYGISVHGGDPSNDRTERSEDRNRDHGAQKITEHREKRVTSAQITLPSKEIIAMIRL